MPPCTGARCQRVPGAILRLVAQPLLRSRNRPDFPPVVRGGIEDIIAQRRWCLKAPPYDLGYVPVRQPQGQRQGRARRVIGGEHPADPEVERGHAVVVPIIAAQRLTTGLGRAVVTNGISLLKTNSTRWLHCNGHALPPSWSGA